ncbi:MAG: mechanosensitive ion channel family protein [Lewinellaceae bacterium]|nr:mechanosensitive ion channel family protein [Saprospiraceae bacterium]MCB9329823.1 mechanosensitive ion channel family protein [Lewinellaceae bacterium]
MDFPTEYLYSMAWTIAVMVGGWLVGWLVESYLLSRLSKEAIFRKTLSGLGRWLGLATGLGLALRYQLLPPDWYKDGILVWKVSCLLIATIFCARMVGRYVHENTISISGEIPATSLIENVVRGVVYMVGVLVILQTLEISVAPVLTALGVGGLAVALALQDTLSNLFAGITIIASRKIRPGQFIQLEGGQEGYVTDITWRNTTIHTLPNHMVIIPNAKLASSIVTNSYLPSPDIGFRVEVGVHYDSDLDQVEQVALATAKTVLDAHPDARTEDEPVIRFREFADSSINMAIIIRVAEWSEQFAIKHEMIKALHKAFNKAGIVIPFPIRTLDIPEKVQEKLLESRAGV